MNKKLGVVNSYRLSQIDKYIAERKEEYINCKNKSNISSFHYEKLIDDIEKILRSFPDDELQKERDMYKGSFETMSENYFKLENIIKEVREKLNTQLAFTSSYQLNYQSAMNIIEEAKSILDKENK